MKQKYIKPGILETDNRDSSSINKQGATTHMNRAVASHVTKQFLCIALQINIVYNFIHTPNLWLLKWNAFHISAKSIS